MGVLLKCSFIADTYILNILDILDILPFGRDNRHSTDLQFLATGDATLVYPGAQQGHRDKTSEDERIRIDCKFDIKYIHCTYTDQTQILSF